MTCIVKLETIKKVNFQDVNHSFHQISGFDTKQISESACNNVVTNIKRHFPKMTRINLSLTYEDLIFQTAGTRLVVNK